MTKNARVLIVDDDPGLLEALCETLALRMPRLEVQTSDAAAAALERIKATDYDAIVADIKMPGMDGLQLLGRIREIRPETPTLLITGHGEHELAVQALRGGAQDYVQKPIDRDYFIGSLKNAIACHRLSRKVAEHKKNLEEHARELQECVEDRTHELRELYHREAAARAELEKTTKELEAARQRQLELMSVIAHELATPLTTLRGYAELLTHPRVSDHLRDRAKNIVLSETTRMDRLVQDLIEDSADAKGVSVQIGPCDIAALVREQLEIASTRSRRHRLVLDAPERLDCPCDAARVAQAVANLLSNAIKYAPGGEVRVAVRRERRQVHITVQDAGPGIPSESLSAIFEPRVRLQSSTRRRRSRPNGAGLGLSIARDIVQAHGGRIWAESSDGHGATFHLVLPFSPSHSPRRSGARASSSGVVEKLVTKTSAGHEAHSRRVRR